MDRATPVRGRDRRDEPAAGAGVDPAGDLRGVARAGPGRRAPRRRVLRRAGPRPDPRPRRRVSRLAAGLDPRRGAGRGGGGRGGRGARGAAAPRPARPANGVRRPPAARLLRARGRSRGGDGRPVARARPARLRAGRAHVATGAAPRGAGGEPGAPCGRRDDGRAGRARLGRAQGRRPLVRRRLRDRPADAGGRGRPVPLDDGRPVPQRGRARPGHARPGPAHRRRRRLRGRRPRRRPARGADRVRAVVRLRPDRGRPVRPPARERGRPVVPGRCRARGGRRDPRLGDPARAGPRARVAGRRAGRGRCAALRPAPRRAAHPARRRPGRGCRSASPARRSSGSRGS